VPGRHLLGVIPPSVLGPGELGGFNLFLCRFSCSIIYQVSIVIGLFMLHHTCSRSQKWPMAQILGPLPLLFLYALFSVAHRPAAQASAESFLEMQSLRPCPTRTEPES
jgi:hypothetical protein